MARATVRKRLSAIQPTGYRQGNPVYSLSDAGPALFGVQATSEGAPDPDMMDPSDRDRWFASEKRRLEMEQLVGTLVPYDQVAATFAESFKRVAAALDTMTDVIEREVGLSPEQVGEMQKIIDGVRRDLYRQLADVGDEEDEGDG